MLSGMGACGMALGVPGFRRARGSAMAIVEEPGKWSKEALYFIETPKGIKCKLCPQACELKPGEIGDCRTNVNYDGRLYSISYGNPCAVNIDPIEKKPLFHYLPSSLAFSIATAGCNLACLNCQNWEISQSSPRDTRNYDLMPDKAVAQATAYKCASIAYTYSDPVAFYEYTLDTSILAREKGIRNILISAGYIHEDPLRRWCKVVDAANIDLKGFDDEIYEMLNAGTLEPVLRTLQILKDEGIWLEITNLVVPTWTDDMDMIKRMCGWLCDHGLGSYPLHFSRFQPQYKLANLPATPQATLEKARQIALSEGIKYSYIGNIPGHEAQHTFCPKCRKLLVERRGFTISQNHIIHSACEFCKEKIEGVWE